MEKEKEGTADNEGLTDLILDEEAMIDLIERYEKDDDWNSYFFRLDEIVRNIITREMAQYKTSLLDRLPKEGSIAPCKECLLEVKSLIEGDK